MPIRKVPPTEDEAYEEYRQRVVDAQERVRAKHPGAVCERFGLGQWKITALAEDDYAGDYVKRLGTGETKDEAWLNADEREREEGLRK